MPDLCSRCRQRSRWVSSTSKVHAWCQSCLALSRKEWAARNPEIDKAGRRRRQRRWRLAHAEEQKQRVLASVRRNPEHYRDRVRRRRTVRAGVLMVLKVDANYCGVCFGPLTDEKAPHPFSTEIGHEPPLAVVVREGWRIVAERPEHRACNRWKGDRIDAELLRNDA